MSIVVYVHLCISIYLSVLMLILILTDTETVSPSHLPSCCLRPCRSVMIRSGGSVRRQFRARRGSSSSRRRKPLNRLSWGSGWSIWAFARRSSNSSWRTRRLSSRTSKEFTGKHEHAHRSHRQNRKMFTWSSQSIQHCYVLFVLVIPVRSGRRKLTCSLGWRARWSAWRTTLIPRNVCCWKKEIKQQKHTSRPQYHTRSNMSHQFNHMTHEVLFSIMINVSDVVFNTIMVS